MEGIWVIRDRLAASKYMASEIPPLLLSLLAWDSNVFGPQFRLDRLSPIRRTMR